MRDRYYEINISESEHELAHETVKALFDALDDPSIADVPMENPTLAFSAYDIAVDEFEDVKGGKHMLVFDVATLTGGKLHHLTPRQLKISMCNRDVFDVVVSAMVDAMHWMADAEFLGSTPTNESAITAAFEVIVDAVAKSIRTRLVRAPRH